MAQTWNAGATTFTAIKMNVTDTASASGSLLMDLQVGGTSRFRVDKAGTATVGNQVVLGSSSSVNSTFSNNSMAMLGNGSGFQVYNAAFIGFSSTGTAVGTADVLLTRKAAASLRLGAADAATAVAQTLGVQSVTGVADTAGANFTIAGSQGTGTGAGGSIIFQVAPAGSSGTAQNALATALTIASDRTIRLASQGTAGSMIAAAALGSGTATGLFFGTNSWVGIQADNSSMYAFGPSGFHAGSGTFIGWSANIYPGYNALSPDLTLYRDAANTLALRNGANAQTFRVYGTTSGANSNFVSVYSDPTGYGSIGNQTTGTGTFGDLFVIAGTLRFQTGATYAGRTDKWRIEAAGHFNAAIDNTYDIGASGATRPRNIYVGTSVIAGNFLAAGSGVVVQTSSTTLRAATDGTLLLTNNAITDFNRIQLGGTTSSFPALKRSSTTLQARLADDSAFAPVQGKLTTETAYTAGDPTTTGYLVIYDSNGTAYKVPAVAL
jgi:hypothetical protein